MSDNSVVIRVISQAGRSRIEMQKTQTFLDLKNELSTRLAIPVQQLKICKDTAYKQLLQGKDSDQIQKIGIKNGDLIYIANQGAQLTQLPPPPKKFQPVEENKENDKEKQQENVVLKDSYGRTIKAPETVVEDEKKDSFGRVIKEIKQEPKHKEVKMIHGAEEKKKYGGTEEEENEKFVKHQSFDNYIYEQRQKCKDKHLPNQKCQNCTAERDLSYKVKYNCADHKPFPLGMCQKCLPPTVILQRQTYRHVDYVSFMNFQEMSQFVGAWQQTGLYEQRMGWLYGYYSEDPNFPDGVRVNVEAIYEPPQVGSLLGVQPLDDPNRTKVDMIAESLGLERVGYIFTSLNKEKQFMTSNQLREIARLQQQHIVDHPAGYKVSKFVTVRVEQKENQEIGVECWMASDICQALERDNVFGDSEDPNKLVIRVPKENEAMPAVLREGQGVKEFEPDFMLISLAHGQPNENNTKFNVLKRYDYPVQNRFGKQQQNQDFKKFIQSSKGQKNSYERLACFQFLIHLGEIMDRDTAMAVARHVAQEQDIDSSLIEIFETM